VAQRNDVVTILCKLQPKYVDGFQPSRLKNFLINGKFAVELLAQLILLFGQCLKKRARPQASLDNSVWTKQQSGLWYGISKNLRVDGKPLRGEF